MEIIQKRKNKLRKENHWRGLLSNIKDAKVHIIMVPGREEREKKSQKCINENVPNLKKEAYPSKANDLKTTIDLEKTG